MLRRKHSTRFTLTRPFNFYTSLSRRFNDPGCGLPAEYHHMHGHEFAQPSINKKTDNMPTCFEWGERKWKVDEVKGPKLEEWMKTKVEKRRMSVKMMRGCIGTYAG